MILWLEERNYTLIPELGLSLSISRSFFVSTLMPFTILCISHSFLFISVHGYSTPRGKTDKLEEAVNRELNVTRSWNFIHIRNLAWFIDWMNFKQICIFYDFEAPLLENRWFSDFKTCIIGFGVKNHFQKMSNLLNLEYFEKIMNTKLCVVQVLKSEN